MTKESHSEDAEVVSRLRDDIRSISGMETMLRIREVTPAELMAERLEREANRLPSGARAQAENYKRQAAMLREMTAVRTLPVEETFLGKCRRTDGLIAL